MSDAEMRELTDTELTSVGGGSVLRALGSFVGGIIGYLSAGAPGAAAGSLAGGATADAIVESAPVQGRLSGQIGYMPSQTYF